MSDPWWVHYVEYYGNNGAVKVESRDPRKFLSQFNRQFVAFRFFSRQEYESPFDGEILIGQRRNVSGWHFVGRRYNLEQAQQLFPERKVMLENMRCNKYDAVAVQHGNTVSFWPAHEKDIVFSLKEANKIEQRREETN